MRWNFEAIEWNLFVALTLVGGAAIAKADLARATEPVDDPAPVAEATDLPPAIRAVQDSLGGPLTDRFDAIRQGELPGAPWWKRFHQQRMTLVAPASAESAAEVPGFKVAALRDAAAKMDDSANRLESLDLYNQADALREVAQRLRIDARRMASGLDNARGVGPMPAQGVSPFGGTILPSDPPRPTRFTEPVPRILPSPVPTPAPSYAPIEDDADSDDGDGPTPVPTPARAD